MGMDQDHGGYKISYADLSQNTGITGICKTIPQSSVKNNAQNDQDNHSPGNFDDHIFPGSAPFKLGQNGNRNCCAGNKHEQRKNQVIKMKTCPGNICLLY